MENEKAAHAAPAEKNRGRTARRGQTKLPQSRVTTASELGATTSKHYAEDKGGGEKGVFGGGAFDLISLLRFGIMYVLTKLRGRLTVSR